MIPRAYQALETGRYNNCYDTEHPYDWCNSTVTIILKNRVYLGHMVNNKSTTKSYKNRKLVKVPESEWIEVKNTHEPLVDEMTWELAQKTIGKRKRPMRTGKFRFFRDLSNVQPAAVRFHLPDRTTEKETAVLPVQSQERKVNHIVLFTTLHMIIFNIVLDDIKT